LVAAVGRINSPGLAESIIVEGKADLITIGRQLIADPEWANKVAHGEVEDIRPCLSCCECVGLVMIGKQLQCAVNPRLGQEFPYGVVPEEKRKKVVVIGGGPAGMEAAATAAFRGHKVILFEKGDRLGGQLLLSGVAPYKDVHGHLTKYLMKQVEKSGVEVRLGWNGDVNSIQKEGPDVVILAAGAVPIVPSIPGVRRKIVVSALDVLSGQSEVGKKVVVVGGGMIGLETAELLSAMGKEVTILEMLEEVGRDTISVLREAVKERLKKAGVDIKTKAEVVEITTRGVKVKQGGKVTLFGGDSVVLACGMRSNNDLKGQLEKGGKKVSVIGDCAEPRRIRFAMEEGFRAGFEI
jgi:NADPH-dependent 2,4-dienoyl-CoA reductase/sulfur reductase-like enzyme